MRDYRRRLYRGNEYPVAIRLDARGSMRLQPASGAGLSRANVRIPPDEGCRSLVAQMLNAEIGRRPVLVTIEEAGKVYALAWLLADLDPGSDAWNRVVARFPARCNRAGALWESTCYLDQGPDTAALFRSLVYRERSESQSLGRIVVNRPDFDVLEKVVMARRRRQRRLRELPQGEQIRWGGIVCKKLSTVMLLPVDRSSRPISGSAPVITNVGDLPIAPRSAASMKRFADAIERFANQIPAADSLLSAHMLIAMQAPLLNAAADIREGARRRRSRPVDVGQPGLDSGVAGKSS